MGQRMSMKGPLPHGGIKSDSRFSNQHRPSKLRVCCVHPSALCGCSPSVCLVRPTCARRL
eukprot:7206426-Prymnesium_polylepis.1